MFRLLVCLVLPAIATAQYPPGVPVKVAEYVIQDGKRIGIAEWTNPCQKCLGACECNGCDCEKPKAKPAVKESPNRLESLLSLTTCLYYADGRKTRTTVKEALNKGGQLDDEFIARHKITPAEVTTINGMAKRVEHPVAQRMPAPVVQPAPVRSVPAPTTFRGRGVSNSSYDPDHNCDRCGTPEYVQSGPGPRPGTHTHTCRRCGNVWFH